MGRKSVKTSFAPISSASDTDFLVIEENRQAGKEQLRTSARPSKVWREGSIEIKTLKDPETLPYY